MYRNYIRFKVSNDWIPCEKQIQSVPSIILNATMDKILVERLENKSISIWNALHLNKMNWEETFYLLLARNFGFKTNSLPFELLAKSISPLILAKHKNNLFQIEALLFGQAGFLDQHWQEKYPLQLQNEYAFLRQKFKLHPIDNHLWKFLRLRPLNFPTIRIAQFASLIHQSSNLFSKIIHSQTVHQLKIFMKCDVSDYWKDHYLFEKKTSIQGKKMGDDTINNLIINTVIPFLFLYGKVNAQEVFKEKALLFLDEIKEEQNAIISHWKRLCVPVQNASASQALLQLKANYCDHKKCLQCAIGNYLLKKV
ncbi:MAG TPA: DUF2851 family protein [Bacteroidia bacterium]|nr:DUF2851 family protein [Bacteroidia bacterium]